LDGAVDRAEVGVLCGETRTARSRHAGPTGHLDNPDNNRVLLIQRISEKVDSTNVHPQP
jgi:hypothetical protein